MQAVEFLLEKGADSHCKNKAGRTILSAAARGGNFRIMKYFVDKGFDINHQDKNGRTILMHAVQGGDLEAVKFMVSAGLDVNAKDKDGQTPLSLAHQLKYNAQQQEIIAFLKEHGAK